jgi:hypothetical protein
MCYISPRKWTPWILGWMINFWVLILYHTLHVFYCIKKVLQHMLKERKKVRKVNIRKVKIPKLLLGSWEIKVFHGMECLSCQACYRWCDIISQSNPRVSKSAILQIRKLRLGGIEIPSWGYTANKWKNKESSGNQFAKSKFLPLTHILAHS